MKSTLRVFAGLIMLLAVSGSSLAQGKAQYKYGVISDKTYLCDGCYQVFSSEYWEKFAKERDPKAKFFRSLSSSRWYEELSSLEVLIIPLTRARATPLSQISADAQAKIKEFVANGGVILSQNSSNQRDDSSTANSNMTFIKNIFGLTFDFDDWNYTAEPVTVLLTEKAKQLYPGLPDEVANNFRTMHYHTLDPAFTPVYLYENKPAVAIAPYGLGGIIVFGFAQDGEALGAAQSDVLDYLTQVTKSPVF